MKISTDYKSPYYFDVIEKVCSTLNCQPGDLLVYVPDVPKRSGKK